MATAPDVRQKSDDLLVIIRQDGDMRIDDKAQHEVGSLLRSAKLNLTLPAPDAVPLLGYGHPDAPPVQIGMAYVMREDPALPQHSPKFMNDTTELLFKSYKAETTVEQMRQKKQRVWVSVGVLILAALATIFGWFIYPTMELRQRAGPDDANATPAPSSRTVTDHAIEYARNRHAPATGLQSGAPRRVGAAAKRRPRHSSDASFLGRRSARGRPPAQRAQVRL